MKFYVKKDILEGHEEAARAVEERKQAFALQKINRRDVTAARKHLDRMAFLRDRIKESRASLEEFYPGFDPNPKPHERDGRWIYANDQLYQALAASEAELREWEARPAPDLAALLSQGAALARRIEELEGEIAGYVSIEVSVIPSPEQEEIEEYERREVARIRGVLELEGTRAPGSPEGFVRVRR